LDSAKSGESRRLIFIQRTIRSDIRKCKISLQYV
jgi:hypothetical protein